MPNIMNMQALGGISQNVPISLPFAVTGGGTAVITNPGACAARCGRHSVLTCRRCWM